MENQQNIDGKKDTISDDRYKTLTLASRFSSVALQLFTTLAIFSFSKTNNQAATSQQQAPTYATAQQYTLDSLKAVGEIKKYEAQILQLSQIKPAKTNYMELSH